LAIVVILGDLSDLDDEVLHLRAVALDQRKLPAFIFQEHKVKIPTKYFREFLPTHGLLNFSSVVIHLTTG